MKIEKVVVDDESLSQNSLMPKVIAYIGLGSNLEQPVQQLVNAIQALKRLAQSEFIASSSFYRSQALTLNNEPSAPDYFNAVVAIETALDPLSLLNDLQAIEFSQGRVRTEQRWESRPLDLDILLFGDEIINNQRLIIPHAEMTKRDFVLVPLAEISPAIQIPGKTEISAYLETCQQTIIEKLP